jgi:hypothetical protein
MLHVCPLWAQQLRYLPSGNIPQFQPLEDKSPWVADACISPIGIDRIARQMIGMGGNLQQQSPVGVGTQFPSMIWENPGHELRYLWDTTFGAWQLHSGRTHTYSSTSDLIETQIDLFVANAMQPYLRYHYSYDGLGNLARRSSHYWGSSGWQLTDRVVLRTDANGNRTSQIAETMTVAGWDTTFADSTRYTYILGSKIAAKTFLLWDSNTQQFQNQSLETYSYNADTLPLTYAVFSWNGNQWINQKQEINLYDNSRVLLQTDVQIGVGTTWKPHLQYRWLAWHDQTRLLPSYFEEDEYSADSIPQVANRWRCNITYGPNNDRLSVSERFVNPQWDSLFYWTLEIDAQDHMTSFELFYKTSNWEFISGYQVDLTYDADLHVVDEWHAERAMQRPDYTKTFRKTYDNFLLQTISPVAMTTQVHTFPNPCSDHLSIQCAATDGPVEVSLYDLQGRLRLSSILQSTEGGILKIQISEALENGCYALSVKNADFQASAKVVVQH